MECAAMVQPREAQLMKSATEALCTVPLQRHLKQCARDECNYLSDVWPQASNRIGSFVRASPQLFVVQSAAARHFLALFSAY
jgi:hypothetical protein